MPVNLHLVLLTIQKGEAKIVLLLAELATFFALFLVRAARDLLESSRKQNSKLINLRQRIQIHYISLMKQQH